MTPPPAPWSGLDPALGMALRPALPDLVAATIRAITAEVPDYADAGQGPIGRTLVKGVEIALQRMLELFGSSAPALDPRAQRFYRAIGAGEFASGRSLEALLAAYRTGARVAWEHLSDAALRHRVEAAEIVVLAESIFVYIDELSAASALGHARAAESDSGYREVLRAQLAQALIDGSLTAAPATVQRLAENADWPIPRSIAVAVVPKRDGAGPTLPDAPPGVLVWERDADAVAVVADPVARRRRLLHGLAGPVYVGTVVTPAQAASSLAAATALREVIAELGQTDRDEVVLANDFLPELLLVGSPALAATLRKRALRPLADVTDAKRAVLVETLAAWLAEAGDRAAVARRLVVHPQTVSYRMHRVRELFGDRLDDPRGRLELQLALLTRTGDR